MDHYPTSLVEAANAVRAGRLTPVQLTREALARVERFAGLNAIAHVDAKRALEEAERLARDAAHGRFAGPLHGIPLTVKDLYNVRGMPTRCGARATMPAITPDEAPAVARLRAAGAVILAKTNMVEIALGTTGENVWTGDVCNPHDPSRMSGGSSSGSAVATAVGIGFGSLGSDTAGSIRIPAAWCGVAGFKPTFGRVPLDGALALCWSCDHAGPLAPRVVDCAVMYGVLSGDPHPIASGGAGEFRLGVPRRYLEGALGAGVRAAFDTLLACARDAGATLVDVEPVYVEHGVAAFVPLRAESAIVHRAAIEAEPERFSPFVRAELERGMRVTAVDYLDGLRMQRLVRDGMSECLKTVDAMVLPTVPVPAPPRGNTEVELESGAVPQRTAVLHLTRPFALAGVPTVSVPFARVDGLPIGLQVVTDLGRDHRALEVAAWIEELCGEDSRVAE